MLKRSFGAMALTAAGFALAGCMGPTYGTGTPQAQQLFEDINSIASFTTDDGPEIAYVPRPELVTPENTTLLPPPQPSTGPASADASGQALSPDAIAARKEAMRNAQVAANIQQGESVMDRSRQRSATPVLSPEELDRQADAFRKQLAARRSTPDGRRYLSEPPVTYRQPAQTAPVGELGVDEDVKERRLEGTTSLGSKIRDLLPF